MEKDNLFLSSSAFMVWASTITQNQIIGFLTGIVLILTIIEKVRKWKNPDK